jgi:hypothetical protein
MLFISALIFSQIQAQEYPHVDNKIHSAFLLNKWQENKPNLIAFTDPRCPYCIKALAQRERLTNYNVYLFWAPILGDASQQTVERFFFCDSPTSPDVIEAVINRKKPACAGPEKQVLRHLNDHMIQQYAPNSVPQYWYGDRRVALSQLNLVRSIKQQIQTMAQNSLLKVPWERYNSKAVNIANIALTNIGLVIPQDTEVSIELIHMMVQDKRFNWYIFQNSTPSSKENTEFRMLTNLESSSEATFVLEGKILSKSEVHSVFNKELVGLLSGS